MSNAAVEQSEDDKVLAYTLDARLTLAKKILALDPTQLDSKDISNALKALDGADKQVISKKRLVLEDKQNDIHAKSAKLLAEVLRGIGQKHPYQASEPTDREPPELPTDFPAPQLNPGETSQVPLQSSVEEFMATQR